MAPATLSIDRDRFLALVFAIAAPGCAKSPAGGEPQAAAPIVTATVEPVAPHAAPQAAAPTEMAIASDAPEASASACERDNDIGEVDCSRIAARKLPSPACEGVVSNCNFLAKGGTYRLRVAEAAVACFDRIGARVCGARARTKCYEEAILTAACPDPKYEAACDDAMERCRSAHKRVTYRREDCVKVLSSLVDGERDWALGAMGPSSEGACKLMFTVY